MLPAQLKPEADSAGGSRCTRQVSSRGSGRPGRCEAGAAPAVPEGVPLRLGDGARGGRAELVSVAVSPWTWGSKKPEKRGCLSAVHEDLGCSLSRSHGRNLVLLKCLSNFLLLPTQAPRRQIQRSAGALEICGLLGVGGSPVRAESGLHRTTYIPVALMVAIPLGNSSEGWRRLGVSCSVPRALACITSLFGTAAGRRCALVDFSSLFE